MANYSLVINSRFKPFSYQELLAPAMQATTAHQQVEEALAELDTKSSIWDKLTNPEADKVAHSLYTNYSKDLEAQAQELARNGLNPTSRQAMLNMRARYAKEITPIEQAYARRKELADEQRKMLATNPTMMYQRMANTMSLDDFIANPLADYGSSYSGAMLTQQVSQAAANLAKELTDYGKGKPVDKYTDTFLKQHGYKGSDVSAIIAALQDPNSEAGKTVLGQLRNSILESTGIGKWADEATMARANNYANQGLWSAVGQSDVTTLANFEAQENLRFAHQLALQKQAQQHAERMAAQQAQQQQMQGLAINPLNIYSSRERAEVDKNIKSFSKYFYRDANGQMKMTYAGWQEYNRRVAQNSGTPMVTPEGTTILTNVKTTYTDSPFKKFVDGMNGGKAWSKGWQPGNLGNLYAKYYSQHQPDRYDATKVTEFDYAINSNNQKGMKLAIMTAARNGQLTEVDYDGKKFSSVGKRGQHIPIADLSKDDYEVISTRFSPYGNTVMIKRADGTVGRYQMPAGINTTNEGNRDKAMQAALQWQNVVSSGTYTDAKGNVHQATPDEITYAQGQYSQALQSAYLYHSQLGVTNQTEPQKFNPYGY